MQDAVEVKAQGHGPLRFHADTVGSERFKVAGTIGRLPAGFPDGAVCGGMAAETTPLQVLQHRIDALKSTRREVRRGFFMVGKAVYFGYGDERVEYNGKQQFIAETEDPLALVEALNKAIEPCRAAAKAAHNIDVSDLIADATKVLDGLRV